MTIKVEQEVLLRVLESQHSYPRCVSDNQDFLLVDFRKPISSDDSYVEKIWPSTSDDDDDSIFTVSTASLSDDSELIERRVSFSDDLVTDVWTRPFTPKQEVSALFYSTEETQK
jgi:hypothetical protein